MVDEDAERVIALARGERQVLSVLYARHAPVMLSLARRMLSSSREAEDVVHDVFVEAWEHAGDFDPTRGSVRQWLLVRVRSRALDRLRAGGRAVDAEVLARSQAPGPDEALDALRARRALADLPGDQVQVLHMAYFRGLSATDIAQELGIPIGTVKSRLAAGMSRLRSALRSEEAAP
jgi:RNA polymerase sigma-70 factor, ECF subfamily